jgi:TPR repeat protein
MDLAFMYEHGRGVKRDQAQAVVWLRKAAALGQVDAMKRLGLALRDGALGLQPDDAAAFALLSQAATTGDAAAHYDLGFMYQHGRGVAQDLAAAVAQYRSAAGQGNAAAQNDLAVLIQNGQGAPQDAAAALSLYRASAGQGHARGQANLGLLYRYARLGLAEDDTEALKWFELAAKQGDAVAQSELARMYQSGIGTRPDIAAAIDLYRKAAAQGYVNAEASLGTLLSERDDGAAESVVWLSKAAEAGNAAAQYNLSRAYRLGRGVQADPSRMMYWQRRAAEQGEAAGMNGLGYAILTGMDGSYDFVESCTWLILAVERSAPGDLHDRAVVNLRDVRAQLSAPEQAEAERRAQQWRDAFAARQAAANSASTAK